MLKTFCKNITLSVTRNPKWFASNLFIGITALWGLCEPVMSTIQGPINRYWFLIPFGLLSVIIAFYRAWPKKKIEFTIAKSNTTVEICFGDLFEQKGLIGIGVNEYFDSQIGKPVASNSLHGYFIEQILGGKKELFDEPVDALLENKEIETVNRGEGKSKRFEIGSTVPVIFGQITYLLFALSKTNDRFEAFTNPSLLLKALNGLFNKARSECNGKTLSIPLIGTGLSRSGVPAQNLIELILVSILDATRKSKVTNKIKIILHQNYYDEIDLNQIERNWK